MSDFIAAACVGVTQVSIGHPFDTTKILMQNNRKWFGLPLRNYYRGWKRIIWCNYFHYNT